MPRLVDALLRTEQNPVPRNIHVRMALNPFAFFAIRYDIQHPFWKPLVALCIDADASKVCGPTDHRATVICTMRDAPNNAGRPDRLAVWSRQDRQGLIAERCQCPTRAGASDREVATARFGDLSE